MALASLALSPADNRTAPALRPPFMAFVTDAESERVIRRALPELAAGDEAVRLGDIAKAIAYLRGHRSPDLLIVDLSGEERPLSMMRQLSEVCEPGVQVVAVGEVDKVGLYRDLLQSGIADYIVKPLTVGLVTQAVEIATHGDERAPAAQKLGKVVTVMGMRGGVGATTICVDLALALANGMGRRVALVDLDLQTGDCSLMLNLKESSALREALEDSTRIDQLFLDRVMVPHGEHLFVLSSAEPLGDELRLPAEGVDKLISALQAEFHYVLVDVPRTPSAATRRALDMAALRILVADETLRSAREIVRMSEVLGEGGGVDRNRLVINRAGERRPGYIPQSEFLAAVEMEAALTVPLDSAPRFGRGRRAAAGRDAIAQAVARLAAEISGWPVAAKKGWLPWR